MVLSLTDKGRSSKLLTSWKHKKGQITCFYLPIYYFKKSYLDRSTQRAIVMTDKSIKQSPLFNLY